MFMISKQIHQIWLQGTPPDRFKDNITSTKSVYNDWYYTLWNEDMIVDLLRDNFDDKHLQMWLDYPSLIQKCDSARHYILYHYGGIYVDLDIYMLNDMSHLLKSDCVLFYANETDSNGHIAPGKLITNSIYYAVRQDKFMNICIKSLFLNKDKYKQDANPGYTSFHTTAGGFITKMYEWYNKIVDVSVLSSNYFEPLPMKQRDVNLINRPDIVNNSLGVHMSVGDWYNDKI